MNMKKRKAQLKIQQMAFMLMALVLFFILASLFYLSLLYSNLKKEATRFEENNAVTLASMLAGSAEFTCGDYCVDTDRLIVLKDRSAYKSFWPVVSIKVRKIYPTQSEEIECEKGNYPDCNLFTIYESGKQGGSASSFVALCRKQVQEGYAKSVCELGQIIVGYEVK